MEQRLVTINLLEFTLIPDKNEYKYIISQLTLILENIIKVTILNNVHIVDNE